MQDASTLATAHYPETLDRIFIIGAPSFFPTVWGWIKKWFDPITTSKIFIIAAADVKTTLESFIEPANIPKKYGGELEFEFGDFPNLDPAINSIAQWEDGVTDLPHGPIRWVNLNPSVRWEDGKGGERMKAVAVGTVDEKQRQDEICTVTRKLEPLASEPREQAKPFNRALHPDLLNVPTAANSVTNLPTDTALEPLSSSAVVPPPVVTTSEPEDHSGVKLELNGTNDVAHDAQAQSNARPELERFVTAREDLSHSVTKEQVPEVPKIEDPSPKSNEPVLSTPHSTKENQPLQASQNVPLSQKSDDLPTTNGSLPVREKIPGVQANGGHNASTNGKVVDSPTNSHNSSNEKGPDSPGIGRSSTEKLHKVVPKLKNLLHHNK